ncbi:MAG: hypothetical protein IPN38_04775 [Flavobacteriales bacterium]|nr:hypothetical protein [Flavobacteriales bacterium]
MRKPPANGRGLFAFNGLIGAGYQPVNQLVAWVEEDFLLVGYAEISIA